MQDAGGMFAVAKSVAASVVTFLHMWIVRIPSQ
jgi:hypothetical protein